MKNFQLPCLDPDDISSTRDALHAYSRILGAWCKSCRPRRKHWWHASLRPSLQGLTTGVMHAGIDFEMEINLANSMLKVQTSTGSTCEEPLHGQPVGELVQRIGEFLLQSGIDIRFAPNGFDTGHGAFRDYRGEIARDLGSALRLVSSAFRTFQSGIREETSPLQLWPHHFDLSLLWLPGGTIPGQDPADEENTDKQMNFGFAFGDEMIAEPYFYVSAYPMPEQLRDFELPAGGLWHSTGFNGASLPYRVLLQQANPVDYLLNLCNGLLAEGRKYLVSTATTGNRE